MKNTEIERRKHFELTFGIRVNKIIGRQRIFGHKMTNGRRKLQAISLSGSARTPFCGKTRAEEEIQSSMETTLRVTLIANAGLLLQYNGCTLMLDGIYGGEGHPFSNLSPAVWQGMLRGDPPFEKIDYLLFSHAHPDHFSAPMVREFLEHRRVKGLFMPAGRTVEKSGLVTYLKETGTQCVLLSKQTDHAAYRIEPDITVQAFSTRHLDKKFQNVHHVCYLITFGEKKILFTADVDYTQETFDTIRQIPLRAVFVNPLFFGVLRRGRFFRGELNTKSICIYHVPFSGDDPMRMRPVLAHDLVEWPPDRSETFVLCDAFQHIDL